MGLQNEIENYLSQYGITKSHMAKKLGISLQQLSAWIHCKLVLPDYHMEKINQYYNILKSVDGFLQSNGYEL